MSLTTAMFTGLTGMDAHSKQLDVIGNNLANVNTVGFKSSRAVFESQLSMALSGGTAPNANSGGTNPSQIGLGVKFAGTQRNTANGEIEPTGRQTDLAMEGPGYFILNQHGETRYTRDGAFNLDSDNRLVANNGARVQGFGVDDNFNIVQGDVRDIEIPLGKLTLAEATQNVRLAGNLNASGAVATHGTQITTDEMTELGSGDPADAGTLMTDLTRDGATALFAAGDEVTINGAEKGGKSLGRHTFDVEAGSTLGDFMTFLSGVLGTSGGTTNEGATSGVSVDAAGRMVIEGDHGEVNQLKLATADVNSSGSPSQPFAFVEQRAAEGESVRTSVMVYDSLGSPLQMDVTMVLEERGSAGTTWRYFAESGDNEDAGRFLDSGTLSFDNFGELTTETPPSVSISRAGTGAQDPMSVSLDFLNPGDMSALSSQQSEMNAIEQDGSAMGTLNAFSIDETGVITGAFSNGLSRDLGQVAVATFANPEGLVDEGGNKFRVGSNSGLPVIKSALSAGAGRIIPSALEQSNVDLSKEFVDMIQASTGYSANSRVISTSDELVQQLLAMAR